MPENLWTSAATIVADGTALGAGRVCFPVDGSFVSVAVVESQVADVLERHEPARYKFQHHRDDRWQNLGGYAPVFRTDVVRRAIATADLPTLRACSGQDLARVRSAEPGRTATALGTLERHVVESLRGPDGLTRLGGVRRVLAGVGESLGPEGAFLHAGTTLLEAALEAGLEEALAAGEAGAVATAVRARATSSGWEDDARLAALELMLGRLASLTDRDEAANHFRRASGLGADALGEVFAYDRGAATYVTAADVASAPSTLTAEIAASIQQVEGRPPGSDVALLVSVDESFFRIYAPQLIHLAQQVPGVDLVILLCGSEDAESLAAEGQAYASALAALNRSGRPGNLHFIAAPVPERVVEARTFYACARFYAVRAMLERYPRLYLMDADLTVTADPTAFLERVADSPLAFHHSRGLPVLWPWRRYAAGNVAVNRGLLATEALTDLETYLSHGLVQRGSWTLDQNALAYVAERNPGVVQRLNHGRRPFSQLAFRATWERTFADRNRKG